MRFLMGTAFGISVGVNLLILFFIGSIFVIPFRGDSALRERHHSGAGRASNKIAVVQVEGVLLEGMMDYARKQIEVAAADPEVKAIVVRINSPGGSITASDDLYRRLCLLRDGDPERGTPAKPLVASMASIAASGGYYIAMPAKHVVAERTTVTGSIGVYAAFPNVTELADKWGIKMEVIKRGDVKDAGSMFHDMTPQERQLWQDLVDSAYDQFLAVVREGRGDRLKHGLTDPITVKRTRPDSPDKEPVEYERRLADGGVFTADKAEKYGLIDQIGFLDDAVAVAAKQAGLGAEYRAVTYDRPRSLLSQLIGIQAPSASLDPAKWANGVLPRVWYLTPGSGIGGFFAAAGQELN
jgi:protease-4